MSQVYRGKQEYVHIEDGKRAAVGRAYSVYLTNEIRDAAFLQGNLDAYRNPLCPGCYMVAVFNLAVELARMNGQSLTELGRSMSKAFSDLAAMPVSRATIESIEVQLDSEPCPIPNQE